MQVREQLFKAPKVVDLHSQTRSLTACLQTESGTSGIQKKKNILVLPKEAKVIENDSFLIVSGQP
jgi:hypothetical protein